MASKRKTRVLIVDDSASFRHLISRILTADPEIEILASAADPYEAVERIKEAVPDVITLDIEMPRMDGLTFLDRIMSQHPIPTVICSSLAEEGSDAALTALERGAVDIITKKKLLRSEAPEEVHLRVCDIVKAAAQARLSKYRFGPRTAKPSRPAAASPAPPAIQSSEKIIVVGASTGGTEALREFLQSMPPNCPGIVIVQHMPEGFTGRFAQRLNQICPITVKEAADGDNIVRGQALIAPGNRHMLIRRTGSRHFVELNDGPLVSRHRPSVDVLFRSAAETCGRTALGVILTGMGDDGANGMLEMKHAGATNFAQDEGSCVVFGMPKEAIRMGGVDRVLALNKMSAEVIRVAQK